MRVAVPHRRAGAFAQRIAERGELAAGAGQHFGGLEVLNGREALEKCGVEPGPLPALTEPRAQLTQRLVEETKIDSVLAPGVARGFQNAHVSEPGHLIEQKQNSPAQAPPCFIDAVQQRAENDSYALGRAAQRLDRHVYEDIELAREQMPGAKRVSAHQAGE